MSWIGSLVFQKIISLVEDNFWDIVTFDGVGGIRGFSRWKKYNNLAENDPESYLEEKTNVTQKFGT